MSMCYITSFIESALNKYGISMDAFYGLDEQNKKNALNVVLDELSMYEHILFNIALIIAVPCICVCLIATMLFDARR